MGGRAAEPFDSMPPAPSGLADACVNVAPTFRLSKPCRRSKHNGGGRHCGNFTRSWILPLIGVALSAPS
jgi:hypothetical protein